MWLGNCLFNLSVLGTARPPGGEATQDVPSGRAENKREQAFQGRIAMNENRRAFYEKLDALLEELTRQIAQLKAKTAMVKAEFMGDHARTLDALQEKRNTAWAKLKELKGAGDEAWDDLVLGLEKMLAEGKIAYHEAVSRFR